MKKRGILVGLALAATLMLGMSIPAFADDVPQVDLSKGVTKVLTTNGDSKVTETFAFTATATTIMLENGTTSNDATSYPVSIGSIKYTNEVGSTKTGAITLPTYDKPGVYVYDIAETPGSTSHASYDNQHYQLKVYVENSDISVAVAAVTMTSADGTKVTTATFNNSIAKEADALNVKKVVVGDQADKTKKFDFTVTVDTSGLTVNDWVYTKIAATGAIITNSGDITTIKFQLGGGESLDITGILAGAKYTVTEADPGAGWSKSGEVTTATALSEDGAQVTVTNTWDDEPFTGLVVNNLPFILMGLVAVAGLFAYGAAKRKLER